MEIKGYSSYHSTSKVDDKELKIQKQSDTLSMQDFLNLLIAQISNQDALNPMENTEFISQMAQFSSLQAMTDLTEMAMQGQATSLIGKNVVVANYDNVGNLLIQEGPVQKVTMFNGSTQFYVNDKEYSLSNLMEVKGIEEAKKPEVPEEPEIPETPEID